MHGLELIPVLLSCGLSAAIVARWRGNSAPAWFAIGFFLPIVGTIAAYLARVEREEPRRTCPTCGNVVPITNQICMRCGADLEYPDEVIAPPAGAG